MNQGPKRNHSQTALGSSKRVKIAEGTAIVDDEQAFDAQVLEDLETRPVSKKSVKNEGYDSDSSDDGEGVVFSRKSGANEVGDDDDDDMFAASGSSKKPEEDSYKKKKERKFLALGDIEGQEFGGGADEDEDDSDEPEDDDDAERRKKAGMGYELTSFNMKAEMEEGKFDQDGTFVRSFDPHAIHDKWMDGLDDKDIKKARKSKMAVEEKAKERAAAQEEEERRGKEELMKELLGYLVRGESTLEALQRLGKQAKKKKGGSDKKKGKGVDKDQPPTAIERVTALASSLMSLGVTDIYDETYESILRTVRRAGIVPEDWTPPILNPSPDSKIYEYRWDPVRSPEADVSQTFGPYSENELIQWRNALYFGGSGEKIQLRRVGDAEWAGWDLFNL
jgi:CD2 antigen cytoplasmic tail-binding protein 2